MKEGPPNLKQLESHKTAKGMGGELASMFAPCGVKAGASSNGLLSDISSNGLLSEIPSNGLLSEIPSNGLLSEITSNGLLSEIPSNGFVSEIPSNVLSESPAFLMNFWGFMSVGDPFKK